MERLSAVGVIDKSVVVLRAIAEGATDLGELVARCGLPRATVHRLAVAWESHGVVRRDRQGRFCLGFEAIRWGRRATAAFPLADLARPLLEALRNQTGESAQLYVRDGDQRRCLVSLPSPHALRWTVAEGSLLAMDRGSAGKVLRGVSTLAESVEEREPGVASVSAAVGEAGIILGAVGISGPIERLSRRPLRRFGAAVQATADQLSAALVSTTSGGVCGVSTPRTGR